ncbi:hypothetical protein [Streptomyces cinereospinus]|uniref:Uncharacterized protein n=1 Tax=Streptomyces cinereospinus TaxID=285561 RepID=A0ABV5MY06_9ACTN
MVATSRFLPALITIGLGFAPVPDEEGHLRRRLGEAGVAAGVKNTVQRIGGSVSAALLPTMAVSAILDLDGHRNASAPSLAQRTPTSVRSFPMWAAVDVIAAASLLERARSGIAA